MSFVPNSACAQQGTRRAMANPAVPHDCGSLRVACGVAKVNCAAAGGMRLARMAAGPRGSEK